MNTHDLIRIRPMLDAAHEARSFSANVSRADLDHDRKLLLSIVKSLEILGEAASKVSRPVREENPRIPWREIITMRHRLIHGYFDIDHDIVWQTVIEDLPPLTHELEKIVSEKGI